MKYGFLVPACIKKMRNTNLGTYIFFKIRDLYTGTPSRSLAHSSWDTLYIFIYIHVYVYMYVYVCVYMYIYRVSQEECARIREGVPYAKVYRYNPKHLCPKLNGYGDNGQ